MPPLSSRIAALAEEDAETNTDEPNPINDIWVACQELGCALQPLLAQKSPPPWATQLESALNDAEDAMKDLLNDELVDAEGIEDEGA